MKSSRVIYGSLVIVASIVCVSLSTRNDRHLSGVQPITYDAISVVDCARCHDVCEKIKGLRAKHLEVLARNNNDHNSPEVSEFLQTLRPLLKEYRTLQSRHPEWQGKPQ